MVSGRPERSSKRGHQLTDWSSLGESIKIKEGRSKESEDINVRKATAGEEVALEDDAPFTQLSCEERSVWKF